MQVHRVVGGTMPHYAKHEPRNSRSRLEISRYETIAMLLIPT